MSAPGKPHISVLLDETVENLAAKTGDVIVDGTFGAGGYARAILATGAKVVAFDRDPTVRRFAAGFPEDRFRLVEARFSEMDAVLGEGHADGVALDLGVSSMQIDEAARGFSFMADGPLDMRMGGDGPTAADLVNTAEQDELARIIFVYGEERESRRIARAIVKRRAEQPFSRTLELAAFVEQALGGRRGARIHPATRTFQGLRIAVNDELGELEAGLSAAERVLKAGGRLCVVTFHSLEDRIVKTFLGERAGRTPSGSRHAPPAAQGPAPSFRLLFNGARGPSEAEVAANPRARSAKLRAAVRTDAPAWTLLRQGHAGQGAAPGLRGSGRGVGG
ncbi:16S rRNA (cytosine(1402)-N(4))-methyltransferase RsmH [Phenylobacterium sp.]|uniref:16S rRNA (cytosine(1402)-N(4))-methyltransferase RsmH n=1 Tax=Phenylobacterium sp. TaxID=1871053 RepID=UPI0025DC7775|nr:16S rRNA (cytosine(1402)-N(4))-methyltransferase RsmH [Phenylobacterium sp.]MBX3483173.1 16S rRNA (cytosine(1402)-N(4))-methyltransferase RsmH [Phenylobacterium sp.]